MRQQPRWLEEVFAPTQALGLMPRRRQWQHAGSEEQDQDLNPVLSNPTPLPPPSSSRRALGDSPLRELDWSLGVSMATSDSTHSGRMVYLNPTALSGRCFVSLVSKVRSLSTPQGSAVAANGLGQRGLQAIWIRVLIKSKSTPSALSQALGLVSDLQCFMLTNKPVILLFPFYRQEN